MGDEGYKFIEEKITHKKPNKIFRYIKKFAFIAAGACSIRNCGGHFL